MIINRKHVYENVLDIPQGRVGVHSIIHHQHPAGQEFPLVSGRTALLGGHRGKPVRFDHATRWHELHGPTGTWMTDLPIEQAQIDRELTPIRAGRVLVGGLGLGYAATVLARRTRIFKIVVVEQSQDVIDLVAPHLKHTGAVVDVVHADLFEYLQAPSAGPFDWAYYDIWQGDGETTFFRVLCPLVAMSGGVVRRPPISWNESVMRGQLFMSLMTRIALGKPDAEQWPGARTWLELAERRGNVWHDWTVPFFQWITQKNPSEPLIEDMRVLYAGRIGSYGFPELWKIMTGVPVPDDIVPRTPRVPDAEAMIEA